MHYLGQINFKHFKGSRTKFSLDEKCIFTFTQNVLFYLEDICHDLEGVQHDFKSVKLALKSF